MAIDFKYIRLLADSKSDRNDWGEHRSKIDLLLSDLNLDLWANYHLFLV